MKNHISSNYLTLDEIKALPLKVLKDICSKRFGSHFGLGGIGEPTEEMLLSLTYDSTDELFDAYCTWHGLIGFSGLLSEVWDLLSGRGKVQDEHEAMRALLNEYAHHLCNHPLGEGLQKTYDRTLKVLGLSKKEEVR